MSQLTKRLLFIYLLFFPLAQLTRIPPQRIELSEIHFYLTDAIIAGMVFLWLIETVHRRKNFLTPSLTKPIFLFLGFMIISLLFAAGSLNSNQLFHSFLYLIRWVFYAGVYFVVFDLVRQKELVSENILNWLGWTGVVSGILGLVQYIIIPDTRFLSKYGWDDHYYRVIGTFLDPGYLGIILVLTLIILTIKLFKDPRNKNIFKIFWAITYLSLALTYSRASYLAFLVAIFVISLSFKKFKFFLKILFLFFATLILLPRPGGEGVNLTRDSTIKFRIINWEHALTIAKDNLVIGVGFNAYRYAQQKYGYTEEVTDEGLSHAAAGVDSSILFVLATTGIFGLLAYLWLWRKSFQIKSIIVLSSGIAILVHSIFTNTLFYPWIMGWWWILLGVSSNEQQIVKRNRKYKIKI